MEIETETEEEEEEGLYYTFEVYSSESGAWTQSNEICRCNNDLVKKKSVCWRDFTLADWWR